MGGTGQAGRERDGGAESIPSAGCPCTARTEGGWARQGAWWRQLGGRRRVGLAARGRGVGWVKGQGGGVGVMQRIVGIFLSIFVFMAAWAAVMSGQIDALKDLTAAQVKVVTIVRDNTCPSICARCLRRAAGRHVQLSNSYTGVTSRRAVLRRLRCTW